MFRSPHRAIALACACALAILVVALLRPHTEPPRRMIPPRVDAPVAVGRFESSLVSEVATSQGQPRLAYRFERGDVLEYAVRAEDTYLLKANAAYLDRARAEGRSFDEAPAERGRRDVLEGRMEVRVYGTSPERVDLGFVFSGMSLAGEGCDTAPLELSGEVIVEVSPVGAILAMCFPKGMQAEQRLVAASVVRQSLLTLPTDGRDRWECEEEDATGRYRAAYSRGPACRSEGRLYARVAREKDRYLSLSATSDVNEAVSGQAEPRGRTEGVFDVGYGCWKSLHVEESLVFSGADLALVVEAGTLSDVFLVTRRAEPVIATRAADLLAAARRESERTGPGGPLAPGALTCREVETFWRSLAGDVGVEQALARLDALFAAGKSEDAETGRTWEALVGRIHLDPDAATLVLAALRSGRFSERTRCAAVDALGSAGTARAQAAIVAILEDPGEPEDVRESAAVGLSQTPFPSAEAEACLRRMSSGDPSSRLVQQALLGLGSQARAWADDDPARSSAIVAFLRAQEGRSAAPEWTTLWLRAIGNAGTPGTLDAARRHMADAEAGVRAAAMCALRFVGDPDADGVLFACVEADASAVVRGAAIRTLLDRSTPGTDTRMLEAASHARAEVRLAAVGYLAARLGEAPWAREALERLASFDPSKEVQAAASAALQDR